MMIHRRKLHASSLPSLHHGANPVRTLGGDRSSGLGSIAGFQKQLQLHLLVACRVRGLRVRAPGRAKPNKRLMVVLFYAPFPSGATSLLDVEIGHGSPPR